MRNLLIIFAMILLTTMSPATAHDALADTDRALFEAALNQAGLALDEMRLDLHDRTFYGGDRYRLAFFDALIDDPLKISPYIRTLTAELLANSDDLSAVVCRIQQRTGNGVRLGLIGDPLAPYRERSTALGEANLAVALAELGYVEGATVAVADDYSSLPTGVRDAAAMLLLAMADVGVYREAAVNTALGEQALLREDIYAHVLDYVIEGEPADGAGRYDELASLLADEQLIGSIDAALLNTGATLLACAAQAAADSLANLPPADESYYFAADLGPGAVVISSEPTALTAAQYPHYLLVISTAGDNHYTTGGASSGIRHPIGVLIDVAGNDVYEKTDGSPAFGCGVFGYGMVIDCAGNDRYSLDGPGLGCGVFGTGILCDYGGNDSYDGVAGVEGSGTFGTGILVDRGGNDRYHSYHLSQGYGFTRGAGLLLDLAGDDTYTADDSDIRFAAPQSPEHNANMCQGFGFGRRGDYLDGHSWAGGVGMLVDGGGDDTYTCGIFGQGCGYWYGTGILVDKSGNDSYLGQWYCQGSGAHFALGILQDDAGDDRYTGLMNMCTGAGHDFSLGWLEDLSGNDVYHCPNLSLGAGNANGIGVFWDHFGDDHYLSRGTTLGCASSVRPGSLRDYILTLGVFLDGGGLDTYLESHLEGEDPRPWTFAGDGLQWSRTGRSDPPLNAEKGGAVDHEN